MKREDWRRAYEPLPDALAGRVAHALAHLDDEQPARKRSVRTGLIALALLLALAGAAYAVIESRTANLFGWFYGEEKKEQLLAGDIAAQKQSRQLGDAVYTLDEVVWSDGVLYGTGHITAAEGAKVVLLPEDTSVDDPAGYALHMGDAAGFAQETSGQQVAGDMKTYAELAEETDSRILHAHISPVGYARDGEMTRGDIGRAEYALPDGSIGFMFEMYGEYVERQETDIERGESYELHFTLHNWQVTPEGEQLREEPNNTWLQTDWVVTVVPTLKGE